MLSLLTHKKIKAFGGEKFCLLFRSRSLKQKAEVPAKPGSALKATVV